VWFQTVVPNGLIVADALRAAPELRPAQPGDDVVETLILCCQSIHLGGEDRLSVHEPVALAGKPGVVGTRRHDQSLEGLQIIGEFFER
jgi:hypothetical protein